MKDIKKKQAERIILWIGSAIALALIWITWALTSDILTTIIIGVVSVSTLSAYNFIKEKLEESAKIKKMEEVFPDFIELVSSNLRAGMTIDKALLIGSRKEFAPLDAHILQMGKDIITGMEITTALNLMSKRTKSEKIMKIMLLIISGIRAGGNISVLLEETATNMRQRGFVEKRSASNVLMYVIFIAFAVAVGAPLLFGLSTVLVTILTKFITNLPASTASSANVGFTLSSINISVNFVTYFAMIFIIVTDILASLILGLVQKGEEKAGLKYIIPMMIVSMMIFIVIRAILLKYFVGFF